MAIDLKALFKRRYEFIFESRTLGLLQCRELSLGMFTDLDKILADKNLTGREFIVKLLVSVAERVPAAEESKPESEREGTPITADEASRLADDEIEAFARKFLAHNPDLLETWEGAKREARTNEKGERVVSIAQRPVDLPKDVDEKDSDHLARVFRRYLDEQSRRMKQEIERLSRFWTGGGLSQATQDAVRENLLRSDRLRGMSSALEARPFELQEPVFRIPDMPSNPAFETNARLNDVILLMQEMRPLCWTIIAKTRRLV
jgi:hypothetical protein